MDFFTLNFERKRERVGRDIKRSWTIQVGWFWFIVAAGAIAYFMIR